MTGKVDDDRLIHWLSDHGYWWSRSKTEWINNQPGGWNMDDVIGALDAASTYFAARGERLRKPLAYVFSKNSQGMSMVTRQQHRRMDLHERSQVPPPPTVPEVQRMLMVLAQTFVPEYT